MDGVYIREEYHISMTIIVISLERIMLYENSIASEHNNSRRMKSTGISKKRPPPVTENVMQENHSDWPVAAVVLP